jgi:hypothetical protein
MESMLLATKNCNVMRRENHGVLFSFNEIFSHGHLLNAIRNHHCGIFVFRYNNNNNNKISGQIFLI